MILLLFVVIFIFSIIWAWRSMRDFRTPSGLVPRFEKKIQRILQGVIHIPKN